MDNKDYEEKHENTQSQGIKRKIKLGKRLGEKSIFIVVPLVLVIVSVVLIGTKAFGWQEKKAEIITISSLEKIIDISELSTFQAIYNGIAVVMNEKKPEEVDYYVSYEARVNAGFDFNKVDFREDKENKILTVELPEIALNDVIVDIASLDYMFQNEKVNTSTVSAQAYSACIADVTNECKEESAIYDLAEQNAINIMRAMLKPLIDQLDADYKLNVVFGGA